MVIRNNNSDRQRINSYLPAWRIFGLSFAIFLFLSPTSEAQSVYKVQARQVLFGQPLSPQVRRLFMEIQVELRKEYDLCEKHDRAGALPLLSRTRVFTAQQWLDSIRLLTIRPKDVVKAHEENLQIMMQEEAFKKVSKFEPGYLKSKCDRIEAELWLLEATSRNDPKFSLNQIAKQMELQLELNRLLQNSWRERENLYYMNIIFIQGRRLLEISLAVIKKRPDKFAVLKEHRDLMIQVEKRTKNDWEVGKNSRNIFDEVRAERLLAEVYLLTANPSKDKESEERIRALLDECRELHLRIEKNWEVQKKLGRGDPFINGITNRNKVIDYLTWSNFPLKLLDFELRAAKSNIQKRAAYQKYLTTTVELVARLESLSRRGVVAKSPILRAERLEAEAWLIAAGGPLTANERKQLKQAPGPKSRGVDE